MATIIAPMERSPLQPGQERDLPRASQTRRIRQTRWKAFRHERLSGEAWRPRHNRSFQCHADPGLRHEALATAQIRNQRHSRYWRLHPADRVDSDASPFFPFIDTFGQYLHKDWPGKTKSIEDLAQKRDAEARELASTPGPKDWDKYGGAASGPKLNATGFFRTEKYKGKWWLVDPDGHLFFSQGIDCVGATESTPISERTNWFADFPSQPEFEQFLSRARSLLGHYAGKSPECFSFDSANLLRKYGPDWHEKNRDVIQQRLRSWGINTIGNWSDSRLAEMKKTPYTDSVASVGARMIKGAKAIGENFRTCSIRLLRTRCAARRKQKSGVP